MVDPISLFVTSLGAQAGKAGVQEASKVLRDIAGLQDAQLKLLTSVDRKVDALLQGPFHAGRRKLADALAPERSVDDRQHLLRDARTFFDVSLSQDPDPLRRSLAALHLACIWLLLGSRADVRRRLEEAYDNAVLAMLAEIHHRSSGIQGLRGRFSQSTRLADESIRWSAAIQGVGPYVNALARAAREWGTPPERAPIFLGNRDAELMSEEQLLTSVASAHDAELSWLISGGTLPVPAASWRQMIEWRNIPEDLTSWPGYAEARQKILRGEYLLWKNLVAWADGEPDARAEIPYWTVLQGLRSGLGRP